MKGLSRNIGTGWTAFAGCLVIIAGMSFFHAIKIDGYMAMEKDLLASRTAMQKNALELSESIGSYKAKLCALENENNELKDSLAREEEKADELQDEVDSRQKWAEESKKDWLERQKQVERLQARLATPKSRREISPQLKKFWPIIEQKAPDLIENYKRHFSDVGPDMFVSKEYTPKLLVWSDMIFYDKSVDYRDFIYPYRAYSPDKKKVISSSSCQKIEDCGVEMEVLLHDLEFDCYKALSACSACNFKDQAWLDENTFMFVTNILVYHYLTGSDKDMVRPYISIYVYKSSPPAEARFALIGEHFGPVVEYEGFINTVWESRWRYHK